MHLVCSLVFFLLMTHTNLFYSLLEMFVAKVTVEMFDFDTGLMIFGT